MNIKLITLALILLVYNPIECEKFKVGTFKNYENGEWTGTIITRTKEFQTEFNEFRKSESKDKIVWIDDCTYRLISIIYKNKPASKSTPDLIVKIINVGDDYFEIEVSEDGKKPTYWSKMIRVD